MTNFDLMNEVANRMAANLLCDVDFHIFYAPTAEQYQHASALNRHLPLTDRRTRGYKYLNALEQIAREQWYQPSPKKKRPKPCG